MESVIETRETKFGKKNLIKLIGVENRIWVQMKDLSAGVATNFEQRTPLPKNSRALINRGFAVQQKKYLKCLAKQSDTNNASPAPKKNQLDPIKLARKQAAWIATAQAYILAVNQVLRVAAGKRASAVQKLIENLKPPQFCLRSLATDNFLDGTLTSWNSKGNVIESGRKLGFLCVPFVTRNTSDHHKKE